MEVKRYKDRVSTGRPGAQQAKKPGPRTGSEPDPEPDQNRIRTGSEPDPETLENIWFFHDSGPGQARKYPKPMVLESFEPWTSPKAFKTNGFTRFGALEPPRNLPGSSQDSPRVHYSQSNSQPNSNQNTHQNPSQTQTRTHTSPSPFRTARVLCWGNFFEFPVSKQQSTRFRA